MGVSVGMTGQPAYDAIAERYRASQWLLFRHFIGRDTLFEVLGDLRGRMVLDLACGDGVYTRQFKRAGAVEVTGVDLSQAMIALAEVDERKDPLGCRYIREDAAAFAPAAPVEIVTAVYLLNYARTREALDRFCRACFRALRPGGRLIGFNDNVRHPPRPGVSLVKYGLERTCAYPLREGDVIQYRITNHDGQVFAFENYYLAPSTYEAAARRAGFDDSHWVDAMLEPTERDDPYWDDFLTHAPLTAFSASKR